MANLYFKELQIGSHSAAGPYLLSKDEIIRFAKQYDPIPRHIDEQAARGARKRTRRPRINHCAPEPQDRCCAGFDASQ
jgi:acyl dehydratase